MAIYAPDPFEGLNKTLMTLLVSKQQREAQAEDLKLRQANLKLQQEEMQAAQQQREFQNAQIQGPQQAAAQQLMQQTVQGMPVLPGPNGPVPGPAAALQAPPMPMGMGMGTGAPPAPVGPPAMSKPLITFNELNAKRQAGEIDDATFLAAAPALAAQNEAEIKRREQEAAFDRAQTMTKGLLTPEQNTGLLAARSLWQSGAPDEMWQALMPQQMMDLAETTEKVKAAKSAAEADKHATEWLVKTGKAEPGGTIVGAAKMVTDERFKIAGEARAAARELQKQRAEAMSTEALGTAMSLAMSGKTPQEVQAALRAIPAFKSLGDGALFKAAVDASKQVSGSEKLDPAQARARLVARPALAGAAVLIDLAGNKGKRWGGLARAANLSDETAEKVGKGLGGGAGGLLGAMAAGTAGSVVPGAGTAAGAVIGAGGGAAIGSQLGGGMGALGAGAVRFGARVLMDKDDEEFYKAAHDVAAAVYRGESQGSVRDDEVRIIIDRYIPLKGESTEVVEAKLAGLQDLVKTQLDMSGLPPELATNMLQKQVDAQHQKLMEVPEYRSRTASDELVKQFGSPEAALTAVRQQASTQTLNEDGRRVIAELEKRRRMEASRRMSQGPSAMRQ